MKAPGLITFDRPEDVSYWVWNHYAVTDKQLWQNCIVAADLAKVQNVVEVAQKMYLHNGGTFDYKPKRKRKPAADKAVKNG